MKKGEIKKVHGTRVTTSEQVSIYLELAEALRLNGELVRYYMYSILFNKDFNYKVRNHSH